MKKKSYIGAALAFTTALDLTGCSLAEKESVAAVRPAVVFVIANTANEQAIDFNSPLVQDTLLDCAENDGVVGIVNADGSPNLIGSVDMALDEKMKKATKERLTMHARSQVSNVLQYMQAVKADDPEVDYLESMNLGVRFLNSLQESYTSKSIINLGSMLGTSGLLDYTNNLITVDPETIADELENRDAIPDFTGITVYTQGLGDVAAPQSELSPSQRSNLESQLASIVKRGGGEFISNTYISTGAANQGSGYPHVTCVNLPDALPVTGDEIQSASFTKGIMLDEKHVTFIPDEAAYYDQSEAEKNLSIIAESLHSTPDLNVLVVGGVAGDENTPQAVELSQERADAVRQSLISMGISDARIIAIGAGCDDPWHVSGAGYDSDLSSYNRHVVILDAQSETAQALLQDAD